MTFLTKWTPAATTVLCFDAPESFQKTIVNSLEPLQQSELTDVYCLHAIILDAIIALFEETVWALRDEVWGIEKVDQYLDLSPECFYPELEQSIRDAM